MRCFPCFLFFHTCTPTLYLSLLPFLISHNLHLILSFVVSLSHSLALSSTLAHLGTLEHADAAANPGDEHKLGAHRELVARVDAHKAVHALIV